MKRKILIITSSLTLALAIALTITLNTHKNGLSDLALDNVEALAGYESPDLNKKIWEIYHRPDGTGHNCCKGGSEVC